MDQGKKVEKKVEYVELFYDLIFVYSLRTINALFHDVEGFPPLGLIATFLFLTVVILQVWYNTTMFFNRYGRKSLRDYISIFINMYLLYYMADGANSEWLNHYIRYHGAWGLIMLNLAYRNWDKMYFGTHLDELDHRILRSNCITMLVEAVIILLSIPIHQLTGIVVSPVALIFGYIAKALEHRLYRQRSVDFPHLSERCLLLVILTFGEMIIGISSFFTEQQSLIHNVMAFLIVIGMFLLYGFFYDNVLDHNRNTSGLGYLTIHVALILAINSTTIALELVARASEGMVEFQKSLFLVLTMAAYYCLILLTEQYCKPAFHKDGQFIGIVFSILLMYALFMLLGGNSMIVGGLATIIMVYGILIFAIHTHKGRLKKLQFGGYLE